MRTLWRTMSILLLLVVFATACGSDEIHGLVPDIPDDAVDMTGQATVTVAVSDNKFEERTIVVSAGTEVIWTNVGLNRHNIFPSEKGQFEELLAETFDNGGSGSRTFDVGAYPYYCSIHGTANRGQRGLVVVVP